MARYNVTRLDLGAGFGFFPIDPAFTQAAGQRKVCTGHSSKHRLTNSDNDVLDKGCVCDETQSSNAFMSSIKALA